MKALLKIYDEVYVNLLEERLRSSNTEYIYLPSLIATISSLSTAQSNLKKPVTLIASATPAQSVDHTRPLDRGVRRWCQSFDRS